MSSCTIFNSAFFTIKSHGNGAAYTIFRKPDNESVFIQYGDDATNFRNEFDKAFACENAEFQVNFICWCYF